MAKRRYRRRSRSIPNRYNNKWKNLLYLKNRHNKKATVNRTNVPVGLGFPKKMCITHKYVEKFSLNPNATMPNYSFSCNSLYDPNRTGTGHQPLYFDQMSVIYDHYCVIGARIKISAINRSNTGNFRIAVYINDDSTVVPADMNTVCEQSNVKWRTIAGTYTSGSQNKAFLTMKWSARKIFGRGVLANDELQGTGGASPVEESFFTIVADQFANITPELIDLMAEIDYIAVWKELKDIAGS